MSKTISLVITTLLTGGAERSVVNFANGLSQSGYAVEIVLGEKEGELLSDVDEEVEVVEVSSPGIGKIGALSLIPGIMNYLMTNEPDVVISFMRHVNIATILSHRLSYSDSFLIVSERNSLDYSKGLKEELVTVTQKILYRSPELVVPNSDSIKKELVNELGLPDESIRTIYNPTIGPEFYNKTKEPVDHPWFNDSDINVILGVGSLIHQKGFDVLIESLKYIDDDSIRLAIIGEGPLRNELEDKAANMDMEKRVSLLGHRSNPYSFMSNADVFVLSSRWEGLPNVVIEALTCGCPVIATNCPGGTNEILSDGEYGLLVPTEDPKAIGEAVEFVMESESEPGELIRRGEQFSMDNSVENIEEIIDEHYRT